MRAIASLGCGGAMRAISLSMSKHAPSRQGPATAFCATTAGGISTFQLCVSAAAKTLGGADPTAAPVIGDGAPAEGNAPTEDNRDEAEYEAKNTVGGGPEKTPTKNCNSRVYTVVSANTPSAIFTTRSDSVARRATFDNRRLAAEQGFTLIIA